MLEGIDEPRDVERGTIKSKDLVCNEQHCQATLGDGLKIVTVRQERGDSLLAASYQPVTSLSLESKGKPENLLSLPQESLSMGEKLSSQRGQSVESKTIHETHTS